jgi:dTDP-4-dehydrorhamnose 3,5-epimerase-like enzyme
MNMKKLDDMYRLLEFADLGDERGNLIVIEGGQQIPFEIKRVFYMYNSDRDVVRGQHANINSQFVLINVAGTSKVKVDNGTQSRVIELNRPHMGIYLDRMLWKDMYDFSEDSVLLVLANTHYDGSEYIRSYEDYLRIIKEKKDEN